MSPKTIVENSLRKFGEKISRCGEYLENLPAHEYNKLCSFLGLVLLKEFPLGTNEDNLSDIERVLVIAFGEHVSGNQKLIAARKTELYEYLEDCVEETVLRKADLQEQIKKQDNKLESYSNFRKLLGQELKNNDEPI